MSSGSIRWLTQLSSQAHAGQLSERFCSKFEVSRFVVFLFWVMKYCSSALSEKMNIDLHAVDQLLNSSKTRPVLLIWHPHPQDEERGLWSPVWLWWWCHPYSRHFLEVKYADSLQKGIRLLHVRWTECVSVLVWVFFSPPNFMFILVTWQTFEVRWWNFLGHYRCRDSLLQNLFLKQQRFITYLTSNVAGCCGVNFAPEDTGSNSVRDESQWWLCWPFSKQTLQFVCGSFSY